MCLLSRYIYSLSHCLFHIGSPISHRSWYISQRVGGLERCHHNQGLMREGPDMKKSMWWSFYHTLGIRRHFWKLTNHNVSPITESYMIYSETRRAIYFLYQPAKVISGISLIRPAAENQKIKCNEPMGYTPISYVIGKRNDGTLRIMMP